MSNDTPLPKVSIGHDYSWALKSTTPERGDVLLSVSVEWSGGDQGTAEPDPEWLAALGAEQVANVLVAIEARLGAAAVMTTLATAMELYRENVDG